MLHAFITSWPSQWTGVGDICAHAHTCSHLHTYNTDFTPKLPVPTQCDRNHSFWFTLFYLCNSFPLQWETWFLLALIYMHLTFNCPMCNQALVAMQLPSSYLGSHTFVLGCSPGKMLHSTQVPNYARLPSHKDSPWKGPQMQSPSLPIWTHSSPWPGSNTVPAPPNGFWSELFRMRKAHDYFLITF